MNLDIILGLVRRGHRIRAIAPVVRADVPRAEGVAHAHPEIAFRWFEQPSYVLIGGPPEENRASIAPEIEEFAYAIGCELAARPDVVVCGRESAAVALSETPGAGRIPAIVIAHGKGLCDAADRVWHADLQDRVVAAYRRCDWVVVVAQHLRNDLDALGIDHGMVIGNTVDTERFFPAPKDRALMGRLGIAATDVVVAHLSNLGPIKRPLDIVHSARQALAKEPRLLFLIVGTDRLRGDMERACTELGIAGRFRFAGWVDHTETPRYINLAEMVVMSSEIEALSLVYLETQACGRVLIASDIPAAREIIEDGVTGLLFPKGSVEDLTDKILLAAGDPGLRSRIGIRGRAQAETRGRGAWLDAYEGLLNALAAKPRSA